MKHLKNFEQLNESIVGDKLKSVLDRLSKIDTKNLVEALLPYKHLLKPYYDKYYVNGVVQPELIEADIRKFNFTAKTNEGMFDFDYADEKSNPLILRILYKVFVRFPKAIIEIIVDHFKFTYESFKEKDYTAGFLGLLVSTVVVVVMWILGVFAYQCGDYLFNGLDNGVAKSGAQFEPAHYETHVHHVHSGKTSYTYTTRDYVPDRWHLEVQGLGEDSTRTEKWVTYNKDEGDGVWKGDTLTNDDNWTWEVTEQF
jgi:hypothetical protein